MTSRFSRPISIPRSWLRLAPAFMMTVRGNGVCAYAQTWFQEVDAGGRRKHQISDKVKRLITFNELNLMAQWPFKGGFDVIFCRNVVIYFDEPTQVKIWSRFAGLCRKVAISISAIRKGFGRSQGSVRQYRHHDLQIHRKICREEIVTMPARVLVVDDSPTMRGLISAVLDRSGRRGHRSGGQRHGSPRRHQGTQSRCRDAGYRNARNERAGVLDKIMRLRPMPVIMVSTLTHRGADASLAALEIGAFDCVGKPVPGDALPFPDLADKVKAAARSQHRTYRGAIAEKPAAPQPQR